MSYWNNRSYFGGQSGNNQSQDGNGGDQYEATSGKKRSSSRLKKSGKKDADADADENYPNYTANNSGSHDDVAGYTRNGNNNNNRGSSNDYSGGGKAYNGGAVGVPYYGGGGYNTNTPYGSGGGDVYVPYTNAPSAFWAPQDGARSPMFISTKEVHLHGAPGSQYDNDNDQRRSGGDGGFFGPAFYAVGHFIDRQFGFNNRD